MATKKTAKEEAADMKIEDFNNSEETFKTELEELEEIMQNIAESVAPPTGPELEEVFPKNEELIAYLEGNFIPYCKTCWEQHRSGMDSSPICPVNYSKCPRLKP
jgi:hypothetical protein